MTKASLLKLRDAFNIFPSPYPSPLRGEEKSDKEGGEDGQRICVEDGEGK